MSPILAVILALLFLFLSSGIIVLGWKLHKFTHDTERRKELNEEYNILKQQLAQSLSEEKEISKRVIAEAKITYNAELEAHKTKARAALNADLAVAEELKAAKMAEFDRQLTIYKRDIENKLNQIKLNADTTQAEIEQSIEEWRRRQRAITEKFAEDERIRAAETFYQIQLSSTEIYELAELDLAIKKLSNPLPFRKAIYDIYYRAKINDLVLRVVGPHRVSGVYKLTELATGKVYIGQSVDIGERWKQHAKRGCGADSIPPTNKLYPAMRAAGLAAFSWQVVEDLGQSPSNSQLLAAERYWQDWYGAKEFGLSIK